ncbi:MAG: sigma-70 family RNA polymerase sigma factor [Firmicutes bacterium]|nr:sigma-70 family RNA polymerase sigma factor [Bacillota bacterium]
MGNIYINQMNSLPETLSDEETNKYLQLVRSGDEHAKIVLKEHNLRLVAYIINKTFYNVTNEFPTMDSDDLFSIGTFGLTKAVETFDISKGIKFATYASRVITNEILMALRKVKNSKNNISLDQSVNVDKEGNELSYADLLSSDEDIEENYLKKELISEIRKSLDILKDREREIIELYYGFKGERFTENQIAKKLGLSQSYVSRINHKTVEKIKQYLKNRGLIDVNKPKLEYDFVNEYDTLKKVYFFAHKIIDENMSVDELSKKTGISSYSIIGLITKKLQVENISLYNQVRVILDKQKEDAKIKRAQERENKKRLRLEQKEKAKEAYPHSFYKTSDKVTTKKEVAIMEKKLPSLFPGSNEEDLVKAINKLPIEEKEMLLLRYPLTEGKQHSLTYIAKQYNIKQGSISWKISSILNKLAKILNSETLSNKKVVVSENKQCKHQISLFSYFPDYKEEVVLKAVDTLSDENKKIMELKYGLNGNLAISTKEIAGILNIKYSTLTVRIVNIRTMLIKRLEKIDSRESIDNLLKDNKKETKVEIVEDSEMTLVTNKLPQPENLEFNKYKDQIKVLINLLNDPLEQVVLLLRLGYVRNTHYTEKEIGKFLGVSDTDINDTINKALSNIMGISSITINGVESARKHLEILKKDDKNQS